MRPDDPQQKRIVGRCVQSQLPVPVHPRHQLSLFHLRTSGRSAFRARQTRFREIRHTDHRLHVSCLSAFHFIHSWAVWRRDGPKVHSALAQPINDLIGSSAVWHSPPVVNLRQMTICIVNTSVIVALALTHSNEMTLELDSFIKVK